MKTISLQFTGFLNSQMIVAGKAQFGVLNINISGQYFKGTRPLTNMGVGLEIPNSTSLSISIPYKQ